MEYHETLSLPEPASEVVPAPSDVILLEDDLAQVGRVRHIAKSHGLSLLSMSDWHSVLEMAARGGRFFVLDIKVGKSSEHTSAGLKALAALRARYDDKVFIAVHSALISQHENAVRNLHPDIALPKTTNEEKDFNRILEEWTRWLGRGQEALSESTDATLLLPSDSLAVRIAGATQNELEHLHNQRVSVAKVLDRHPPRIEDLIREIGARMRDEFRGVLRGLAERGALERKNQIDLTDGPRLTTEVVRSLLRALPITYGADEILEQLRDELCIAARHEISGEYGQLRLSDNKIILTLPETSL